MTAPALPLFAGMVDGIETWQCTGCGRRCQKGTKRAANPLPDIPRFEVQGRCGACYAADRRGRVRPARRVDSILTVILGGLDWSADGACTRAPNPDAFAVPDNYRGEGPPTDAVLAARRYCGRCPVVAECAEFADRHGHVGVWGAEWRSGRNVTPITTKATA